VKICKRIDIVTERETGREEPRRKYFAKNKWFLSEMTY
jgi:hypothetical protein